MAKKKPTKEAIIELVDWLNENHPRIHKWYSIKIGFLHIHDVFGAKHIVENCTIPELRRFIEKNSVTIKNVIG